MIMVKKENEKYQLLNKAKIQETPKNKRINHLNDNNNNETKRKEDMKSKKTLLKKEQEKIINKNKETNKKGILY